LSAFIFGRSSRIVPMPSATSSRTNSPTLASLGISRGAWSVSRPLAVWFSAGSG